MYLNINYDMQFKHVLPSHVHASHSFHPLSHLDLEPPHILEPLHDDEPKDERIRAVVLNMCLYRVKCSARIEVSDDCYSCSLERIVCCIRMIELLLIDVTVCHTYFCYCTLFILYCTVQQAILLESCRQSSVSVFQGFVNGHSLQPSHNFTGCLSFRRCYFSSYLVYAIL